MTTLFKLRKKWRNRESFTLVEMLIATMIFVIVGLMGVTIFVNVMRVQRRVTLENQIYEDARFMMERISREIRLNTVDYEEYFNVEVLGDYYGSNTGCYASTFYHPGTPNAFGAVCSVAGTGGDCEVIDKNSLDVNTGQNPYSGADNGVEDTVDNNAFCVEYLPNIAPGPASLDCVGDTSNVKDRLYLINPQGNKKTLIARQRVNATPTNEYAVALARLRGRDEDQDGITEVWKANPGDTGYYCDSGFECPPTLDLVANLDDANNKYQGAVPFTPQRTTVTQLQFIVAPVEDPRKAFAETAVNEGIQQQPHVTVIMTVEPAADQLIGYAGDPPSITLQTTITSRVYNEVKSYLGPYSPCDPLS
jgi:type II secretory pathway pseudopilin PulG